MQSSGVNAEIPFFNPAYEQEKNALIDLKHQLKKSDELTQKVNAILTDFDGHLLKLHSSIKPVFDETENLQICQKNIENSLKYVDYVNDCYKVAQDVEYIIRKGPSSFSEGGSGLDVYLKSFNRLMSTKKYFQKHNPHSLELNNVNSLIDSAGDSLIREFKSILFMDNKIPRPEDLLSLIKDQYGKTPSKGLLESYGLEMYGFSLSALRDLSKLANCLLNNGRDEYMTIYGQIRSTSLQKTLQALKDYQQSDNLENSFFGLISKSGHSSPSMKTKFHNRSEAVRKPSTKKVQSIIEKKANRMFLKASQTLESSTNFLLGSSAAVRRSSFLDGSGSADDLCNEQDIDAFFNTVSAFCKLLKLEQVLMQQLIPNIHQPKVFEIIARESLDNIVQESKSIAARAKKTILKHDFFPMLSLFPAWDRLRKLQPDFDKMTENCDNAVRAKFESVIENIYLMTFKVLEEFMEKLRGDSSQLPKDGMVYETTSTTMIYICQLFENVDIVGEVFQDLYEDSKNQPRQIGFDFKAYFGIYIRKILGQLSFTLISRSDQYNDASLKALFRLNNNNYILKTLQRNPDLLATLKVTEPNCEKNYYQTIENHKKDYLKGWSKLIKHIKINESIVQPRGDGKLREKDRNFLKDQFSGFNKEMEEIAQIQREYAVPDVELRESLKRDNKELILPKYNAFYEM